MSPAQKYKAGRDTRQDSLGSLIKDDPRAAPAGGKGMPGGKGKGKGGPPSQPPKPRAAAPPKPKSGMSNDDAAGPIIATTSIY